MGKTVDFQKVRKKRQRSATIKRLFLLGVVVAAVAAAIFINNLFIEEGVTTHISDVVESFGGPGYPRPLPGGVIRNVKSVGNNLAILNDTNLYLYNKKGKQINNLQQMSEGTVLLTAGDRILLYDVNSRKVSLHSVSKHLFTLELEDRITGVSLGEKGNFAVITTPKQYVSSVTVYNEKFNSIYYWNSPASLMKEVALSPKGTYMTVASLDADENGVLETTLHFFRLSVEGEQSQEVLSNELVLELNYLSEDKLAALTDGGYAVMNGSGERQGYYSFGGAEPSLIRRYGSSVLLLLEQKESHSQSLVLLDDSCKLLGSLEEERIRDVALGQKRVYVLTDAGIRTYNHQMELQEQLEQRGITRIHMVGNRLYYFTPEEICVLDGSSSGSGWSRGESSPEAEDFWQVEEDDG